MGMRVVEGDITRLHVDVIVNAANNALAGGGGVDGAIHRAAGPHLPQACRNLGRCDTGDVKATPGFELSANAIYHTVGPVWQGGMSQEPELLASCYRKSLELAARQGFQSIAFPAISCGVYGYPADQAVTVAVTTVQIFLEENANIDVIFCCFARDMAELYRDAIQTMEKHNH